MVAESSVPACVAEFSAWSFVSAAALCNLASTSL